LIEVLKYATLEKKKTYQPKEPSDSGEIFVLSDLSYLPSFLNRAKLGIAFYYLCFGIIIIGFRGQHSFDFFSFHQVIQNLILGVF